MTAYISGPITGYDLAERQQTFAHAATEVQRILGCETVNPMNIGLPVCGIETHTDELTSHEWVCWMKHDIKAMMDCDTIVMLPGWADSNGALEERRIALSLNFKVYYLSPEGTLHD